MDCEWQVKLLACFLLIWKLLACFLLAWELSLINNENLYFQLSSGSGLGGDSRSIWVFILSTFLASFLPTIWFSNYLAHRSLQTCRYPCLLNWALCRPTPTTLLGHSLGLGCIHQHIVHSAANLPKKGATTRCRNRHEATWVGNFRFRYTQNAVLW